VPRSRTTLALLGVGLFAFVVSALSIGDMYLPRPYDGVVLETDVPGRLVVREVVPGSGAARAGVRAGDEIVGIARTVLRSSPHAAALLNRHEIGETVPYLLRAAGGLREVEVELGPRRIGDTAYLYEVFLGFSFFFIGLFVLLQQPRLGASQVFFILCCLFLLFLVCQMRPASYSGVDTLVLGAGTAALVFLPAAFLHFFAIFPRPLWEPVRGAAPRLTWPPRLRRRLLIAAYALPPLVLLATLAVCALARRPLVVINGAPVATWWVLAVYVVLGLGALAANAARLPVSPERRGAGLVLLGSLLGLVPFLVLAVGFPSFLHTERFVVYGVAPLVLVPLTFSYAIIRFRLLDVRLILRKSLLYTATTAVVTGAYALGIAFFNALFHGTAVATSPYFPIVLALAIVLLFEPLRRRIQVPIDRFFFADRSRLQAAMMELGEAFTGRLDPAVVVHDLVRELPRLLGLRFAALYLLRGDRLERAAGPAELPPSLDVPRDLYRQVRSHTQLVRVEELAALRLLSSDMRGLLEIFLAAGVEVVGDLASSRRRLGLVLLSGKEGHLPLEEEELRLLRGLLHQAAIALETSLLLEERARQAELEREVQIAAAIQASLLPRSVELSRDWEVAAVCRPARHVGGDFYAQLPGPNGSGGAIVYGDVSGKSVSGALMMMAAKEALHSLALAHRDPEELLGLANRRLRELGNRSFVALGYLACAPAGEGLRYLLAGQPPPLRRRAGGAVDALPLPEHRLPLGAMLRGRHRVMTAAVEPGDLVLAYSDGVIEAQSPRGEFFGEERLAAVLAACPAEPQAVLAQVLAALEAFTAGADPYDDVTLLALARRPDATAAGGEETA
jgi:serine phosphatase RsbU (regulator of sigma subunit)